MIQKFITTLKWIFSKPIDEPRRWNCGHVCKPSELAQHVKDEHMQVKQ